MKCIGGMDDLKRRLHMLLALRALQDNCAADNYCLRYDQVHS